MNTQLIPGPLNLDLFGGLTPSMVHPEPDDRLWAVQVVQSRTVVLDENRYDTSLCLVQRAVELAYRHWADAETLRFEVVGLRRRLLGLRLPGRLAIEVMQLRLLTILAPTAQDAAEIAEIQGRRLWGRWSPDRSDIEALDVRPAGEDRS